MSLFRPCIDLHNGQVKQIVGSTLTDSGSSPRTNFVAEHDSAWYARALPERQPDRRARHQARPRQRRGREARAGGLAGGLQLGGGVNCDNAAEWLEAGASQLIVTSFIFSDGELRIDRLEQLFDITGRERLVLDLSCRRREDGKYYIVTDRWQKFSFRPANPCGYAGLSRRFRLRVPDSRR